MRWDKESPSHTQSPNTHTHTHTLTNTRVGVWTAPPPNPPFPPASCPCSLTSWLMAAMRMRSIFFTRWGSRKYRQPVMLCCSWPHIAVSPRLRLPASLIVLGTLLQQEGGDNAQVAHQVDVVSPPGHVLLGGEGREGGCVCGRRVGCAGSGGVLVDSAGGGGGERGGSSSWMGEAQTHVPGCVSLDCSTRGAVTTVDTGAAQFPEDATSQHPLFNTLSLPLPHTYTYTHTWTLIMSLLLLSGMSMGASTVLRLSGSAWNWLRLVALPSCTLLVLGHLEAGGQVADERGLAQATLTCVCSSGGWKMEVVGRREREGRGQGNVEGRPVWMVVLSSERRKQVCVC